MCSHSSSLVDVISSSLTLQSIIFISPALALLAAAFLLRLRLSIAPSGSSQKSRISAAVFLPASALSTIVPFFRQRFDFLNEGFRATSQSIFQFRLFHKTVIAISGESGRKAFLTTKAFDLHSGFADLLGGIPLIKGVTTDLDGKTVNTIYRRLATVQSPDRLAKMIPQLLDDCTRVMGTWGDSATIDPFTMIYELIFQLSVRCISSVDIADDALKVRKLKGLYDLIDEGNTPATVMFPWFPSWGMLKKLYATWKIYDVINESMVARLKSGKQKDDTMQMLLNSGDGTRIVVGFAMGLIIAGSRSTGTTASWLITFMGAHPEWKAKAAAEMEHLMKERGCLPREKGAPLSALATSLSQIPLEYWESRTPVLDSMIGETLRLAQPHTAMRRNLGPEIYIDGKVIPTGAYVVYPFSDVHLNPDLYDDPYKFDPTRPRQKTPFGFIGFGGGKNICLGQRMAKLEMKLVAAMFLLGTDFSIVDAAGRTPELVPRPDWNDILGCKPPKGSCLFDYHVRC